MLLQVPPIQRWAAGVATQWLSEKTGVEFSVSGIEISLFNRAYFKDLYIESPTGDTMIYAKSLDASINNINFFNGKISLGNVTMDGGRIALEEDSTGLMNIKAVFDHLKAKQPPKNRPNFRMSATQLNLLNTHFTLARNSATQQREGSINFKNLDISEINFQAQNIELFNYDVRLAINHFSLKERSGFQIDHLSSPECGVNETGMRFSNLRLESPLSTLNCPHFNLLYESWWDYNDFVNKVTIDTEMVGSRVDLRTINYFAINGGLDIAQSFTLWGRVIGRVPALSGEIAKLELDSETSLNGSFTISGLPEVKRSDFLFTLDQLSTNARSVNKITENLTGKALEMGVMNILERGGSIHASGEFFGLLQNFKAECHFQNQAGLIDASLDLHPDSLGRGAVRMVGTLKSRNFDLGRTLASTSIGRIDISSDVDALVWGDSLDIKTNAHIDSLVFGDYKFTDIDIDGGFNNQIFVGSVVSAADSNLLFETYGAFDFRDPELPAYNFDLDIQHANLVALGINNRDSISTIQGEVTAEFTGTNIDNINGRALIDSIFYSNHLEDTRTGEITLGMQNSSTQKEFTLRSEFADITLQGRTSYSNIFGYLAQMARSYIPSFDDATQIVGLESETRSLEDIASEAPSYQDGYYTLKVDVKQANNVANIFMPGLDIASGSKLDFFFNPAQNNFSFTCNSAYIATENQFIEQLNISSRNVADSLSIFLTSSMVDLGSITLPKVSVIGAIKNNKIDLGMRFSDSDNTNSAIFNTSTRIYRTAENLPQISIALSPSNIRLNKRNWLLSQSEVLMDSTGISIKRFAIQNAAQRLAIDGKIGREFKDSLDVSLKNISLEPAGVFIENLGYTLSGTISGDVFAHSILTDPNMIGEVQIEDLHLSDNPLGDAYITSEYSPQTHRIELNVKNARGQQPIKGHYDLQGKEFYADINFPEIELRVLEPLLKGSLVETSGKAAAKLVFTGTGKTPTLNGTIDIEQYNAMVGFTRVKYALGGQVKVENNRFSLEPTTIIDPEGRGGMLDAFFDSEYFKNMTFGVNAQFEDMLALNTTTKDNPYFYGKAYGTGTMQISGTQRNTNIVISGETALNSNIVMPFTDISTIDQSTFLTFIDKSDSSSRVETNSIRAKYMQFRKKQQVKLENELDIKLDLQVLPNTLATISYTNSLMENIITGRGRGRLQMQINPTQDIFSLQGPVNIEQGTYRLIFAIADKTFNLASGGSLMWTGDAANPLVDFTGIYKVRTSIEPLSGVVGSGGGKTNINCGIKLTDRLMSPSIAFDITAPNATPETQNIIRNSLNTEEALSMQFMSLFVSGAFMPDMSASGIGSMGSSILSTTGLEFISNQISNLISTQNLRIRPTFRPRTSQNSEEVGVQASISLLEDKLFIEAEGNYTAGELSTNQQNPFTGEGGITVMLNKAQTLSMKGFTRVIDRFDESQGLQESGIGLYFRQGFQSWADLKARYMRYLEERRARRSQRNALKEENDQGSENSVE